MKKKKTVLYNGVDIKEGSRVRLDVDLVLKQFPKGKVNPKLLLYVETLRRKTLTVEYDEGYRKPPVTMICFKEDQNDPKFLFQVQHIIPVKKG